MSNDTRPMHRMVLRCMVHVLTLDKLRQKEFDTLHVLPSAEHEGNYKFVYEYPLDNPVETEHPFTAATTVMDLLRFGQADYEKIYAEEDATAPVAAQDSQKLANGLTLMNRTTTKGKHGIWGHVLNDLWFEGIHIDLDTKTVTFDIGS